MVGAKGTFPAVFATADPGWTFSLQLFPERGEALLSGGTPCLPDPAGVIGPSIPWGRWTNAPWPSA